MSTSPEGDRPRRFGPLPLENMDPAQRAVADAILSGPRGGSTGLRGPFEALLRSPDLADAVQRLGEYVRFRSALPAALNEMAILLTAVRWRAQFEFHAHARLARAAGLPDDVIEAIRTGATPGLEEDGRAVHAFATQLLQRGDVDDETFAAVTNRWGQRGAIDLIGVVGYYCLVSFVLNVDRYPVPGGELPFDPSGT